MNIFNPFLRLHIKLSRTAKALKQWAKHTIGNNKLLICAARQLIAILDVVQEHRQLSSAESLLRRDLKARYLGLTAVEKLRARQQSRLINIKANEANSKLFFLQANGRRRKNFIRQLQTADGLMHTQEEKANYVYQHFTSRIGMQYNREVTLDWDQLQLPRFDLQHLEVELSEEEVKTVVQEIAAEKAPGPDGFIGAFYKSSWGLIKEDVLQAINYFYNRHDQYFNLLNNAHIVLLPKKDDAASVGDYRPISLSHSITKLISKLLAVRLSADLNSMVSRAQNTFIKRSIHDNFLYTQNLVRALHKGGKANTTPKARYSKSF